MWEKMARGLVSQSAAKSEEENSARTELPMGIWFTQEVLLMVNFLGGRGMGRGTLYHPKVVLFPW